MLISFSPREESGEAAVSDGFVVGHLAVGLDAVLQAVKLPVGIACLDPSLLLMDR